MTVVDEGTQIVDGQKDETPDKHPETVPWSQYVGIKEKFTRVETDLKGKVSGLEEQLKQAVNKEEYEKVKTELETTKTKLQETSTALQTTQEQTLAEKRAALVAKGVPEEKAKDLSAKELDTLNSILGVVKTPLPDLGGGAGATTPGKAKDKIKTGFEALHPVS